MLSGVRELSASIVLDIRSLLNNAYLIISKIKLILIIDLHWFYNNETDLRLGPFKYQKKVNNYRKIFLGSCAFGDVQPKVLIQV